MADDDVAEVRSQLHDAVYATLIENIRRDRYPSATMMNMVEAGLPERQLRAYAAALLDKVAGDRFPSIDMVKRLTNLL
jgi:hypothetical protein